jgi:hypothetical protein
MFNAQHQLLLAGALDTPISSETSQHRHKFRQDVHVPRIVLGQDDRLH